MELTETPRGDRPFIERYGPGSFTISGRRWTGPVLILADRAVAWPGGDRDLPGSEAFSETFAEALAAAVAGEGLELLILGLGAGRAALPTAAGAVLRRAGLAVEAMDTGAACRTYTLLAGEGRPVGAALLPLPG